MKKFALMIVTLLSLSWTIGCEPPKPAAPKGTEAPAAADKPAPEAAPVAPVAPAADKPADKPKAP